MNKKNMLRANKKYITLFILAVLMLLMGLYSGEEIFYIVFLSIFLFSIYCYVYIRIIMVFLDIECSLSSKKILKGSNVELFIELTNNSFLLIPKIVVKYHTLESYLDKKIISKQVTILPKNIYTISHDIECRLWGSFPIGIVSIEISDMFNFLTIKSNFEMDSKSKPLVLKVNAKSYPIYNFALNIVYEGKNFDSKMKKTDELANISNIRKYRIGDTSKKIHWKLTARLNEVMIKNYEISSMPEVVMHIDNKNYEVNKSMQYEINDHIVQIAICYSSFVLSKGLPIRIYADMETYTKTEISATSLSDIDNIYNYLNYLEFNNKYSVNEILDMQRSLQSRKIQMIITYSLSADLVQRLLYMKENGVFSIVFLVTHPTKNKNYDKAVYELVENSIDVYICPIGVELNSVNKTIV